MPAPKDPIKKMEWKNNIGKALSKKYLGLSWDDRYGKEQADRLRENQRNKNLGKKHTEEHKRNIRESCKGINTGELNGVYGKTYEDIYGEERAKELREEKRLRMLRENNHQWLGGKSREPYNIDFDKQFKNSIKDRENRCCIICNIIEEEVSYGLSIHHIDYQKTNSFPQNCVTLCKKCHAKTNFNRVHWKKFFQSLLAERYGYEYTEDQKIVLDFTKDGI